MHKIVKLIAIFIGTIAVLASFTNLSVYADNPPEAIDDFATTTKNTPVTIDVAANDTDQDGNLDPTTVVVSAPPSNGTAISNGDGTITYTPDTSFTGI